MNIWRQLLGDIGSANVFHVFGRLCLKNGMCCKSSPRRGEKLKQMQVSQEKEMEIKGAKQTKLAFAATRTPEKAKNTTSPAGKEQEKTVQTGQEQEKTVQKPPDGKEQGKPVPKSPEGKEQEKPVQRTRLTFVAVLTGTPTNTKTSKTPAITPDANAGS